MFEYNTSHLSTGDRIAAARSRHGIARKAYQDSKTAIALEEGRMRRRSAQIRFARPVKRMLTLPLRLFAGHAKPTPTTRSRG